MDPQGMITLLNTLWAEEQHVPGSQQVSWFSTHPATAARMSATQQQIRALPASPSRKLARDNDSYAAFLRRLDALPPSFEGVLPPGHPPVEP